MLAAVSAQAVAKGHHRIAEAVMNLDDDLIPKLIAWDLVTRTMSASHP